MCHPDLLNKGTEFLIEISVEIIVKSHIYVRNNKDCCTLSKFSPKIAFCKTIV